MQINNASPNFGSIKFSPIGMKKTINEIGREIKKETDFKFNPPQSGESIQAIRNSIPHKSATIVVIVGKPEENFRLIGKTAEEEASLHKSITATFDPGAKLIKDAPKDSKLELLG